MVAVGDAGSVTDRPTPSGNGQARTASASTLHRSATTQFLVVKADPPSLRPAGPSDGRERRRFATGGRLLGAAVGLVADRVLGEPTLGPHPVALLGRSLAALEQRSYADRRAAGVVHTALGAATGALGGAALRSTALATWLAVAGRMLAEVAVDVGRARGDGDLDRARALVPALVGRDPAGLDEAGLCRAVVESLAETSVDAIVAPALWAAAFGPAGAGAHKAIDVMDSMVGYHSDRYEHFGWPAARLDDAAAWLPARATAALVAIARPRRAPAVWRAVRHDAPAHPSPNAGVAEAAFAAALGLRLGGTNRYGDRVEHRATLGTGRTPARTDITAAGRLSRDVTLLLAATLAAGALVSIRARRLRSTAGAARISRDGTAVLAAAVAAATLGVTGEVAPGGRGALRWAPPRRAPLP